MTAFENLEQFEGKDLVINNLFGKAYANNQQD
jgi:hypothetical protein